MVVEISRMINCELHAYPIDVEAMRNYVTTDESGAQVVFIGTTRNHNAGKEVDRLFFEAYEPMAIKEMKKLCSRVTERWEIHRISMIHRLGEVKIGEEAVVIAVSSAHRKEAFQACEFLIDELKKSVPIWKKEFLTDGSHWVSAHP